MCFGVTEPDAGLNTTALTTRAVPVPGGYRITGQKLWTSTAQIANKILLIARTTPREEATRPTEGLTLFYTDLDRSAANSERHPEDGPGRSGLQRPIHR